MNMAPTSHAEICTGRVFHKRFRPVEHAFSYGVFFIRVPINRINELKNRWFSLNRFNLLSFHVRDYGPRDGTDLESWARALLRAEGVNNADGEIVLQTFPRLLGYVFNPISLWFCHDSASNLRATICEVSNTFGERHNYLVTHDKGGVIEQGDWLEARKVFHVSPFCDVKGRYRFQFEQSATRAYARIDYFDGAPDAPAAGTTVNDDATKLIITTVNGTPQPVTAAAAFTAFFTHPLMTFSVVARIHWQALKLWLKRVPFFTKPQPPALQTTR